MLWALAPLLFLSVPLLAIVVQAMASGTLIEHLASPMVTTALGLSAVTTITTLLLSVLLGTPLAYLLARRRFPGHNLVDALVDLPIVVPPVVAGVALLTIFGRRGLLGQFLAGAGLEVAFTTLAVILAQTFVAAPFYIRAAKLGFQGVDPMLERVSTTLGVSDMATFRRITLPLALPSLLSGCVMTWARAMGEFGATIMFAGNLRGRTQTMPLAIYSALESDLGSALALAVILIIASFGILWLFRRFTVDRGNPYA